MLAPRARQPIRMGEAGACVGIQHWTPHARRQPGVLRHLGQYCKRHTVVAPRPVDGDAGHALVPRKIPAARNKGRHHPIRMAAQKRQITVNRTISSLSPGSAVPLFGKTHTTLRPTPVATARHDPRGP